MRSSRTARKRSARPGRRGGAATQLLAAACRAFAEKGFHDATVAEICEQAGANIAAVNYYFGDKETLYVEAWRLAFQRSLEAHPPDGGVPSSAPAEERLRGHILSLVQRVVDPETRDFQIARKEMANPTALLDEVIRECLHPLHEAMAAIVRELLGPHATEQQVQFCEASIVSQCFDVLMGRHLHKERRADDGHPPVIDDIHAYAQHVATFSLAGIQAVREQAERGSGGGPSTDASACRAEPPQASAHEPHSHSLRKQDNETLGQ